MVSDGVQQVPRSTQPPMAARPAVAPPVLSTPDTHIFEAPVAVVTDAISSASRLPDGELWTQYEIQRTIDELRTGGWTKVALQFPDEMLGDAVRVYDALDAALNSASPSTTNATQEPILDATEATQGKEEVRLCILGDTSYGACCVDEIAAEHVDAQVVVHYGRTCFSATARLPVIYVYTTRNLDLERLVQSFTETYDDKSAQVVLVADAPYAVHLNILADQSKGAGYEHVFKTELIGDGKSPIPNRTVPEEVVQDGERLRDWHIFHVGQPPTALLLTLASRVASMTVYPNEKVDDKAVRLSSALTLRRRYALVTSLSTCAVYGILINTLSVKNYLHIVEHVKRQIAAAGKKYYTFVVGKVNAAKIANFSEVGGWVVIGCWESSLVESSEFYVPLITPFELQLALQADDKRVWTGEWTSNFEAVLNAPQSSGGDNGPATAVQGSAANDARASDSTQIAGDYDSEEESAPPEFDLRTGRYIQHSRPMRHEQSKSSRRRDAAPNQGDQESSQIDKSLVARPKGDIARAGHIISPGAEYLRSQRTWQGLGSEFGLETDFTTTGSLLGALVEQGRSGVARGYTVGESEKKT